jgi:SSS family solute:Na+ symporter
LLEYLWLLVTFLTKPVNHDKLEYFYKKVRPDGIWTPFNKVFRLSNISNLIICWLSAVCLTYGSLFLFGKLIFKEWQHMIYSLLIVVISFIVLRKYMRKINILD